eukprot:103702-Pleurochrysis_carterae.AAC.1
MLAVPASRCSFQVETLMNDSVYVETRSLKQHYLKPKYSSRASAAAWEWVRFARRARCGPRPLSTCSGVGE